MPRHLFSHFSFPQDYFKRVEATLVGQIKSVDSSVLPHVPTLAEQRQVTNHVGLATTPIEKPSSIAIVKSSVKKSQPVKNRAKVAKSPFQRLVLLISILILITSLIGISIFILPKIYLLTSSPQTITQQAEIDGTPIGGKFVEGVSTRSATVASAQPPIDDSLPKGEWIIIPRIGVRTEIQETDNQEKALEKGIWRIPGYGLPGQAGSPLILASHRFGYTWWWQNNYWKYNSFHLLPETEPGDLVEIISGQRKYTYEIYAGEEGQEITDYNADLILYTCKFLDSPVRYFRYARLVDWSKNTQAAAQ